MKHLLTLVCCLYSGCLLAQPEKGSPVTHQAVQQQGRTRKDQFSGGYQTPIEGWAMQKADTLQLGKGSLPSKDFAFLYENPVSLTAASSHISLSTTYSGKRVELSDIAVSDEGTVYGLVDVGTPTRYYLDINKAIESGELLPPVKYRPSALAAPAVPVIVAKELIKLKTLLNAGTITQDEYNTRRKKLLAH